MTPFQIILLPIQISGSSLPVRSCFRRHFSEVNVTVAMVGSSLLGFGDPVDRLAPKIHGSSKRSVNAGPPSIPTNQFRGIVHLGPEKWLYLWIKLIQQEQLPASPLSITRRVRTS